MIRNIIESSKIKSTVADTAALLEKRGWAEKNAGNISWNITEFKDELIFDDENELIILNKCYPSLKGNLILITATNSRMRDIARNPEAGLCLLDIIEDNKAIIRRFCDNPELKPTSELPTHLLIQNMLAELGKKEKAVLHTHADELIALSHSPQFKSTEKMTELIWSIHPESIVYLPDGLSFIPYTITGSPQLAEQSLKVLSGCRTAVWEKHGAIAIGETPLDAFDLIDTAAKSVRIYFMCKNAGFLPEGLNSEQLRELRTKFGQ